MWLILLRVGMSKMSSFYSYFSSCLLVLNPSICIFFWCIEIPVPGSHIVHWDYSLWFQLTSLVTNFSDEKWSGSMTYFTCHCLKPRTEKENKETYSVTCFLAPIPQPTHDINIGFERSGSHLCYIGLSPPRPGNFRWVI